jgi:hypothetical protein
MKIIQKKEFSFKLTLKQNKSVGLKLKTEKEKKELFEKFKLQIKYLKEPKSTQSPSIRQILPIITHKKIKLDDYELITVIGDDFNQNRTYKVKNRKSFVFLKKKFYYLYKSFRQKKNRVGRSIQSKSVKKICIFYFFKKNFEILFSKFSFSFF